MKYLALTLLAAAALVLPACTTVEADHSAPSTTSTTHESTSVRTPVGGVSQSTTTRSY
jgi:outer membrane biogenesis lipoprotein LolB